MVCVFSILSSHSNIFTSRIHKFPAKSAQNMWKKHTIPLKLTNYRAGNCYFRLPNIRTWYI